MPETSGGEERESEEHGMYEDSNNGLRNEEKVVLNSFFQQSISRGTKFSMHEFQHQMHTDLFLRTFATDAKKVKKMYGFVRARIRREAHLREIKVDKYDFEGVKMVPSSMSRKQWLPDDEKCIEKRFQKFDKLPIKSPIL